ncbi:hypothetical protein GCM10010885_08540 [Alicyclobacillus cellulosilyticus]|uniref:Uncharacterized protein n=1 Tax=Alicyclobacillus cellulosilyticus TaxID=1003997 RepID=A0A917K6A9_9BACL|nr:hypothetical protein [Alicyclobacillus cellulosilyticus]GGJ01641.1 hypothetical protein GCM10010885_08540 [Alicyclobacillus cellulosilyticus]
MKVPSLSQWAVGVMALIMTFMQIPFPISWRFLLQLSRPPIAKDYVLPGDHFDQKTMDQIKKDLQQYGTFGMPLDLGSPSRPIFNR